MKPRICKDDEVLEILRQMPETRLHNEIIIPLLKSMDFKYIQYVHGSFERGKDIIYVSKDAYGENNLGVCQVKNEPFSGKASSKMNTIAILHQMKQCRSIEVLNPETNLKELPQNIVLINTYSLPDRTTADAGFLLTELHNLQCKVITGEKLVDLIRTKTPDIYEKFAFPGEGLTKALSSYITIHRESSAFDISRERALTDFYVDLGIVNFTELDDTPSSSYNEKSKQLRRETYDNIKSFQSVLPEGLSDFSLIELSDPCQKGDWLNVNKFWFLEFMAYAKYKLNEFNPDKLSTKSIQIMVSMQYFARFLFKQIKYTAFGPKDEILERLCEFTIPEITPETLLEITDNICIVGEAGAGKTSLARILVQKATEKNIKVIYFPCALLKEKEIDLLAPIKRFLTSLLPQESKLAISNFLKHVKIIILDGCDEAGSFGEDLAQKIKSLAFSGPISEKIQTDQIAYWIPTHLKDKVVINPESNEIHIMKPLSEFDFQTLISSNEGPIAEGFKKLEIKYRQNNPKIILTSRIAEPLNLTNNFFVTQLKGFSDRQLEKFFKNWLEGTQKSYTEVLEFLNKNKYVHDISRIPMIATVIAALFENGYDLPCSKSDLYNKRFNLLLNKWQSVKGIVSKNKIRSDDKFLLLIRLSLKLHLEHHRQFNKFDLEEIWSEGFSRIYPQCTIDEILWDLQICNGVIYAQRDNEYSLGHLSYQEFLVANAIVRLQALELLVKNYFDPWWKNVIVFYAGICGDVSKFLDIVQMRHGLYDVKGLLSEITNEARFTSSLVNDFMREGLESGMFHYEEDHEDDYQDYDEDDLDS